MGIDREVELCRANALKYQKRLMELQEVIMARGVLRSSSNPSQPSGDVAHVIISRISAASDEEAQCQDQSVTADTGTIGAIAPELSAELNSQHLIAGRGYKIYNGVQ